MGSSTVKCTHELGGSLLFAAAAAAPWQCQQVPPQTLLSQCLLPQAASLPELPQAFLHSPPSSAFPQLLRCPKGLAPGVMGHNQQKLESCHRQVLAQNRTRMLGCCQVLSTPEPGGLLSCSVAISPRLLAVCLSQRWKLGPIRLHVHPHKRPGQHTMLGPHTQI